MMKKNKLENHCFLLVKEFQLKKKKVSDIIEVLKCYYHIMLFIKNMF